jgi:hypothetical protein
MTPDRARGEEVDFGRRETDPETGEVVALEYWKASETLPEEFLRMLPQPPVGVPGCRAKRTCANVPEDSV